tara:strand:- start:108 stop:701 length:594 start_codon:yes stop_codon:yes gene_type:complete
MVKISPFLYQYLSVTSSSLITLPIDILQTKTLTDKPIFFDINELKWLFLFPIIFTSQNIVFNKLNFIKSITIRGACAGIITSPIYIYLETNKLFTRLKIFPNYTTYIRIIILRQIIFYSFLYKITFLNIKNSNFIAAFIANSISFPIKLFALFNSYSIFIIDKKIIRYTAILEIIKSSISDGIALFLIYSSYFSPLK